MNYYRILTSISLSLLLFVKPGSAQKTTAENTNTSPGKAAESSVNYNFHLVPAGDNTKVFYNAVTGHIVSNKGIQDFYSIPTIETQWLSSILDFESKWHEQLQKLEQDYRKTFQERAQLKSGQNDRSVRIGNYTTAISKLENEIAEIRRQIVQINVDQQVYINGLREMPITSLVAIKTLYTPELMNNKNKLDVLNSSIFKSIEEPVLGHVSVSYGKSMNIPFQAGHIQITYLYPENITHFDSQANELVYLFLRVEAYPFSAGFSNEENAVSRGVNVKVLADIDQIKAYLKTANVGDKRLQDWLTKESNYQNVSNGHLLNTIRGKLDDFRIFRNGLKQSISELTSKAINLAAKRDSLAGSGEEERIESEYKRAKGFYHQYYANRKVLTHEKYTLENDVMFSRFYREAKASKKSKNAKQKQMVDSNIAANIPISGRPLKDIFADILTKANQKSKIDLQNYRERIYRSNEEQTQLIQGELEWVVKNEEFSILKLTRGNVGSRSHFVVHLAKRTLLRSKPGFPSPKKGICKATLLFKRGKDVMRNSSKINLDNLAKCLSKFPQQLIQITGHTDPLKPNYGEGSKYSNVTLGLKRAEKTMAALVKLDFNQGRFVVISKGAKEPVASGKKEQDSGKNRRVEVLSKPNFENY